MKIGEGNKASVSFRIDKNVHDNLRKLVPHKEKIGQIVEDLIKEEIGRRNREGGIK